MPASDPSRSVDHGALNRPLSVGMQENHEWSEIFFFRPLHGNRPIDAIGVVTIGAAVDRFWHVCCNDLMKFDQSLKMGIE
jgi:hypothetical protein